VVYRRFTIKVEKQHLTISNSVDDVGEGAVKVGADGPGVGDAGAESFGAGGTGEARGSSLVGNDRIWEGDGGEKNVETDMVIVRGRYDTVRILNFDSENDTWRVTSNETKRQAKSQRKRSHTQGRGKSFH